MLKGLVSGLDEKAAGRYARRAARQRALALLPGTSAAPALPGIPPRGVRLLAPDPEQVVAACHAAGIGPEHDAARRAAAGGLVQVQEVDPFDGTVLCRVDDTGEDVWFASVALMGPPPGTTHDEDLLRHLLEEELALEDDIESCRRQAREAIARVSDLQWNLIQVETRHHQTEQASLRLSARAEALSRQNSELQERLMEQRKRAQDVLDTREEHMAVAESLREQQRDLQKAQPKSATQAPVLRCWRSLTRCTSRQRGSWTLPMGSATYSVRNSTWPRRRSCRARGA